MSETIAYKKFEKSSLISFACFFLILFSPAKTALSFNSVTISPESYSEHAEYFVDAKFAVGISGSIYQDGSFHDFFKGYADENQMVPISEDTYFELGSATKVFTAALFALDVVMGNLNFDQKVSEFFEELKDTPVGEIKLIELVTHSSGLARIPDNFEPSDYLDPYKDYNLKVFLEYLKKAKLGKKTYLYSNTGFGLLSQILSRYHNMTYSKLLNTNLIKPLALQGISAEWSDEVLANASAKFDGALNKIKYWSTLNAMDGTGIIKINLKGLKQWMAYQLQPDLAPYPYNEMIKLTHTIQRKFDVFSIGIGWFEDIFNGRKILSHNGSTSGFTSEIYFDLKNQQALLYLSNTDLLSPGLCLVDLFTEGECDKPEIKPFENLENYVGQYEVDDDRNSKILLDIKQHSKYNFLYVVIDGAETYRLFYDSPNKFYIENEKIVIEFLDGGNSGFLIENWEFSAKAPFKKLNNL